MVETFKVNLQRGLENILWWNNGDYFAAMMHLGLLKRTSTHLALLFLVISLSNCTRVFSTLAPFSDLPAPTGPFAVATETTTWVDSTRDETFTPAKDYRKIVVQVWYPVSKRMTGTPLPYIDDPELRLPAIAKQLRLPQSLINHFQEVKTNAFNSPRGSDLGEQFPIILFSHGLSGMRFQNSAVIEELASHGYVIFAADHSFGANITIFDDGEPAEYRAGKRRSLNEDFINTVDLSQIEILVGDLQFIVDEITSDRPRESLKGVPLDAGSIGIMGHSLGGAAALTTMARDARIKAAMILDGWYAPVPDFVIKAGLRKPLFHLGQLDWADSGNYMRMDELLANGESDVYKMLIPGTLHTDFTDMPLFTPFSLFIGYTRIQNPLWLNQIIRSNTTRFFDVYLKGHARLELKQMILSEDDVSSYIFCP